MGTFWDLDKKGLKYINYYFVINLFKYKSLSILINIIEGNFDILIAKMYDDHEIEFLKLIVEIDCKFKRLNS
jgi:predicted NACHT family NTPase